MTTIGIRELARSSAILEGHDYAQIEDKKTKQAKGLIVSNEYAEVVKKYIDKLVAKKRQQEVDEIMQFAGSCEIHSRFLNLTDREIREKIAQEKYGE
ncbi:hypothetical protein SPONL_1226 [uncultured Candidatus Thioglobus sp.]|nr:hypothetical protein SPONL_1226 [uncultured Candidatus Thioglobus sp.]